MPQNTDSNWENNPIFTASGKDETVLELLLSTITEDNMHLEITFGELQGKELL